MVSTIGLHFRKSVLAFELVLLVLLSSSQLCLRSESIQPSPASDSRFPSSSGFGEAVVDGANYYVLQGDFHMHTKYSDGSAPPAMLVRSARSLGYDFIAVTDHVTTRGALKTKEEAIKDDLNIIVIIGQEVTTDWGHLLALNVDHNVLEALGPNEACREIHVQGGYAVPAHPVLEWDRTVFKFLVENSMVDAYEAYSGRSNWTKMTYDATPMVVQIPIVGNSDTHSLPDGFIRTIVFSVNRTVEGIFDAVLDSRVVIKRGAEYVGNPALVQAVESSSGMFEAKASIGSAESNLAIAKETAYLTKSDRDVATELIEESIYYYWINDYEAAVASAQEAEGIALAAILEAEHSREFETLITRVGATIIIVAAGTLIVFIVVRRCRRQSPYLAT